MDVEIIKANHPNINFDFEELSTIDDSAFDAVEDTLRTASSVGNATQAGLQTASLQSAIDGYAQAMNQSAIAKTTGRPVKTPSSAWKGFAAEEHFKHTLKINALAKGVPDYKLGVYTKGTLPDGSNLSGIDMETDISIWTRKRPWSKPTRTVDYQAKMYNDSAKYKTLQNNPQYDNVELVGASGNDVVNDVVSVDAGKKTISSDSITSEEATSLADSMKAQDTPEYQNTAEKYAQINITAIGRYIKRYARRQSAGLPAVFRACFIM